MGATGGTAGAGIGDGGCAPLCKVSIESRAAFQSRLGEVDYARFCLAACRPPLVASAALGLLCVEDGAGDDGGAGSGASAGEGGGDTGLAGSAARAMAQLGRQSRTAGDQAPPGDGGGSGEAVSTAALILAKGAMKQAMYHAQAAGEAARTARDSYQQVLASSRAMAEAAANATIAEIRREASEQATEAMEIRLDYERKARDKALKRAADAAMVYKRAKVRNLAIARQWEERAGQFVAAARQREGLAADAAVLAERYGQEQNQSLERQQALRTRQAEDQAAALSRSAEAAEEEAAAIRKGAAWYDSAAQAAAAHVLAKSLPPGVPPPPFLPLP